MRFAYMDEAGNTGRKLDEREQPIHLILSLVIDEAKIAAVHEHVREVGRLHCPNQCHEAAFELHGADLFAARGPQSAGSRSSTTFSGGLRLPKPMS